MEVKYHPLASDAQKLSWIAQKHGFTSSWLVGRYPTPSFDNFIWGGCMF